ncbi:Alpha/Beta hydrolase protein [Cokeromyces recurvatus]|uniref:Alpha/Beta hydrolase protein n=1 Tax=Cokeromyces recurvatus TaxID=90255 RepID=UPI00221F0BCC|nr:Alpha/Beta hydrolase protein [Cokeromyces recurvatus]KAI7906502.1 Alpha/Beta hydrolase protein [Cokeromyces recurvatus]
MLVPQRLKKIANVAEKQIGTHVIDAKNFVFTVGKRTVTSITTTSSKTQTSTETKTVTYASNEGSLLANTLLWAHLIPPVPVIVSTMYRHYAKGPPAKSWSLSTDITIAVIRDFLNRSNKITVEDIQKISSSKKLPIPSSIKRRKFVVPNEYRKRAGDLIAKLLTKKDEERIGWNWQKDRENAPPIKGEWLQQKGNPLDPSKESTILYLHGGAYYLGCYGMYRQFLCRIIKYAKCRTCAVDYRLAPQHPFPAALEDALATYLFMIDPPKDNDIHPIDPKKIIISGDSAGGGLTFALLIAIRDSGLPAPAGGMTLSPWLDLTHSLPSIISNIMTDYLPPTGFKHAPSPALDYAQLPAREEDLEILKQAKAEAKATIDLNNNLKEPLLNNESFGHRTSIGPFGECVPVPSINGDDIYRIQFYAANEALKVPLVSPIFDRSHLRGLPRILVQCGSAERLRDESIYASLQATDTSPIADEKTAAYGKPTHVALEIYTDQPHVFQLLFSNKSVSRSIKNLAAFVHDVTNSPTPFNNKDKNKPNYVTNELLTVRNISPNGKITNIKNEMLSKFTKEEWNEWERRLDRPSIKQRMDDVLVAYERILKEEEPLAH